MITTAALKVTVRHDPFRVSFATAAGESLDEDDPERGIAVVGKSARIWKRLRDDEHVYGFGEKNGRLDKRGNKMGGYSYAMWNSDTFGYMGDTDPIYASVPFYLVLRNGRTHGIFLDNTSRTTFDVGRESQSLLSFGIDEGELDYYFLYGPTPRQVVERYTDAHRPHAHARRAGRSGFNQCRYSYYPESKVRFIADNFRQRRIPADVIWLDIHYQDGFAPFTWDPVRFPDPKGLISDLRADGFRTVTILDAHPEKKPGTVPYDTGLAGDHFVKNKDGSVYEAPVWPSEAEKDAEPQRLPRLQQARGPRVVGRAVQDPARRGRGRHLERHERARDLQGGRRAPCPSTSCTTTRASPRPTARSTTSTACSTPAPPTRGCCGCAPTSGRSSSPAPRSRAASATPPSGPATTCPTGRPCATPSPCSRTWACPASRSWARTSAASRTRPSPELFTRWLQMGVFYPFMRVHTTFGTPDQEPWSYGLRHEELNRRAIELRYELLPHIYNVMEEASRTGIPALRPLLLEYPDDGSVYGREDEFLFGADLLVAPGAARRGDPARGVPARGRVVRLLDRDGATRGGGRSRVPVTLESIPIFVRSGALVFRQPVVQHTGEMPGQPLVVGVYGDRGAGQLYEDDGETLGHTRGRVPAAAVRMVADRRHRAAHRRRARGAVSSGGARPRARDARARPSPPACRWAEKRSPASRPAPAPARDGRSTTPASSRARPGPLRAHTIEVTLSS